MGQAKVGRWGNSLAVRLPGDVVQASRLREGSPIEVVARGDEVVIRQREVAHGTAAWFAGKSPQEWRAEYAETTIDWGPDVGREVIPD